MFNILLIRYADGAVYAVVVMALVTPLGSIFWMFFTTEPYFRWHPVFDQTTIYVLVVLVIMMPAVVMYTYFSGGEEELPAPTNKEVAPPSDSNRSNNTARKPRANTVMAPEQRRSIPRVRSAPELV